MTETKKMWVVHIWEDDGIFFSEFELSKAIVSKPYGGEVFKDNPYRLEVANGYVNETFFEHKKDALKEVEEQRKLRIKKLEERIKRLKSLDFTKPFREWKSPRGFE